MQKIKPKAFIGLASKLFEGQLPKSLDFTNIPSLMLWGQPGVGKTASVFQLADAVEKYCHSIGKKVKSIVTTVDLTLYNPVDLRGIPTVNAEKTASVWLRPYILDLKEKVWVNPNTGDIIEPQTGTFTVGQEPDASKYKVIKREQKANIVRLTVVPAYVEEWEVINFFFMDELSAAPASLQVCAYQITHDRRIGEHKLPKNTYPICAGNRTTDKSVAYAMPKALANRVIHLEFDAENFYEESWMDWAIESGVDQRIIAFLGFRKDLLNQFSANSSDQAFATPRSWENASKILDLINDVSTASPLIAGTVGEGPEIEFRAFCNVYTRLPKLEDITSGKFTQQFSEPDVKYAISTMLIVEFAKMKEDEIRKTITYVNNMSPEFSAMTGRAFLSLTEKHPNILGRFIHTPEWQTWLVNNNRYLVD